MPASTGDYHYRYGPSSLKELKKCPSRKKMIRLSGIRQKESYASAEGTWCHEATEYEDINILDSKECIEHLEKLSMQDGKEYNENVREYLKNLVKEVLEKVEEMKKGCSDVIKEQLVSLHSIDGCKSWIEFKDGENIEHLSEHLLTMGSMDMLILFPDNTAIGIDYKYGTHQVDAVGNIQGLAYCSAILEMYPDLKEITFYIFQPKLNHYDKGDTYYQCDLDYYRNEIKEIVDKADSDTITLNASRDACFFCTGKFICPAFLFNSNLSMGYEYDRHKLKETFKPWMSEEEFEEFVNVDVNKLVDKSMRKVYGHVENGRKLAQYKIKDRFYNMANEYCLKDKK